MDGRVGLREKYLIAQFGVPDATYDAGDARFVSYSSTRLVTIPGVAPTYRTSVYGNTAYTTAQGGIAPSVISMTCQVTFRIEHGIVAGWTAKGNDCE